MYGNGRGTRTKPQRTQPIPVDTKTIHNVETEGEGMKTPQSASKGKQPVKEKKARGKKGKKSNPNKDSPKKQVSVVVLLHCGCLSLIPFIEFMNLEFATTHQVQMC